MKWIYPILFLLGIQSLEAYSEKELQSILINNKNIKKLDSELNILYNILKDFSTPEEQSTLLLDQKKWLKERSKIIDQTTLEGFYAARLQTLKNKIKKKEEPILSQINKGEPAIDIENAKKVLKDCPTLTCQGYLIYFNSLNITDPAERAQFLKQNVKTLLSKFGDTSEALRQHGSVEIASFNGFILPSDRDEFPDLTVPLWLYVKEKEIQNYDTGTCFKPYSVNVLASDSIKNLPSFEAFNSSVEALNVEYWMGGGTSIQAFRCGQNRLLDHLSFAPNNLHDAESDIHSALVNPSLEKWAFKGPWNWKTFHTLKSDFEKLSQDLKTYYESFEYLDRYAPYTANFLNSYVTYQYDSPVEVASEPAYKLFSKREVPLKDVQNETKSFTQADWNPALSYAILNNYEIDVLDWLIASGADVNSIVDDESQLIKAANRPEILKYLIKKGAGLEGKNNFGKTALFYAIQLDNLDSVKFLVDSGADVNSVLIKGDDLKVVVGFKPLAYSMRYGSESLTNYLVKKGANISEISLDKLEKWVKDSGDNDRFKSHMILVNSRSKK